MSTSLLSPLAARQRFRRLMGTAAGFALALAAPAVAQAQTVYGLGLVTGPATGSPVGSQLIGSLNVTTGTINIAATSLVTGVTTGQTLVGMDSRPATGELFALGYDASTAGNNSQLYTLNPTSGVAMPVGNVFRLELGGATERIGVDFNPTVDRIRVVGSYNPTGTNTNNYRLNPTPGTGGVIAVINDGVLAYASGTPADPNVGAAAYTNSAFGASTTVLYDVDETNGLLAQQSPPNNGTLGGGTPAVTPVAITLNGAGFGAPKAIDIDTYVNPSTGAQSNYLIEVTAGGSSNFYNLNLATGAATSVGVANVVPAAAQVEVRDIAAAIAPRVVPALMGQLAYAVTTNNNLISFDTQNPSVIRTLVAITGLGATQTLVGTDFRPNTGELFGLGYDPATGANDRLYTINVSTGAATAVGTADIDLPLGTDLTAIGFDFNPTVDRIRVVSANRANYRLNPNNGAIAFMDGTLTYAAGDPNVGQTPTVGTGAYINSFVGSTATGLYVLDHALGTVSLQSPPNNGTLTNSRQLTGVNGTGTGGAIGAVNDLDVYFDGTTNTPYLAAVPNGQVNSRFYSLNALSATATGAQVATDLGPIGGATSVRDISVLLAPNSTPTAAAALSGRLLYAVANGNLISFDSGNPGVIRTAVNITGLPADGSQVLAGADFRPLDGSLFALGYNATTQQGQLYSLNISTGALAAVGALQTLSLGTVASAIGFDFNPTVDRIRIVSATNQANLRVNPADGSVTVDTNVTNPDNGTAPAIAGAAYTNNDNNGNTGTMLYGYDQTANVLTRATVATGAPAGTNAANAGTYRNVGSSSGISVGPGVDFDIYADLTNAASPANTGFIVAAPVGTASDNLYTIDLTSGAASAGTRIGNGSNLTALAAFLTPGPVIAAGLTWTGAVSTDWATAGNWSPAQVPTATDNVTIPSATNAPVVNGSQLANAVTLLTGATLTLADGSVLGVSGNIVNNSATVVASGTNVTGRVTLAGAAAQTISGTLTTFPNLTVGTAGASIGGPVSIRRGLVLNGTFTTTNQTLTLLSDATGTAYVVNNGSAAVSGAATVQRYIMPNLNAGPGYRHYSSPVSGNTVADFTTAGYSPTVSSAYNTSPTPGATRPYPNIFTYDQSRLGLTNSSPEFDKGFESPGATTDAIQVGRGYTVNIPGTELVDFTGVLNTGPVTRGSLARGTQATAGWQLLGNPYPGAIDYNTILGASSGIESALYVFKSNGQYTGTYTSYVNGASTNTGTNVLPVAQAFFTRVLTGQTGAVNFTNAARLNAPDNTPFQRTTAGTRPELTLTLRSATAANQAVVYFEQGATAGFDSGFDAHYLPSTNGLLLATEATGAESLAINGQTALTGADVTVPLLVAATTAGTYALQVDNLANLPTGYFAYLRDGLTGTYTNLAQTASIPLTLAATGAAGGRYAVVFTTQARVLATAPAALAQLASVFPNPARGTATLLLPVALRGQQATAVTVVDNVGRVVLSRTLAAGTAETLELPLAGLAPGVYSVLARTAAGLVAKRLVVE